MGDDTRMTAALKLRGSEIWRTVANMTTGNQNSGEGNSRNYFRIIKAEEFDFDGEHLTAVRDDDKSRPAGAFIPFHSDDLPFVAVLRVAWGRFGKKNAMKSKWEVPTSGLKNNDQIKGICWRSSRQLLKVARGYYWLPVWNNGETQTVLMVWNALYTVRAFFNKMALDCQCRLAFRRLVQYLPKIVCRKGFLSARRRAFWL